MHLCDLDEHIGSIKEDYKDKINLAFKEINNGYEFIYLHAELIREDKSIEDRVKRLEDLDNYMLKSLLEMLGSISDEFKIMLISSLLNDNNCRSDDPVPFLM